MASPTPLRIVADENIPHVQAAFDHLGPVRLMPGRAIGPAEVREADVLLVRSVTPIDEALLGRSRVRFVGSATIGTDHVDHSFLSARGIHFTNAPGSNALGVVEYVIAALLRVSALHEQPLRGRTVGIVGCGNIGGRLAGRLGALGTRVLVNDPPLARQAEAAGQTHAFLPLDDVLDASDIVTLHVPLTRTGPDATVHLIDDARLRLMRPGAWLVNACRGPVVDGAALLEAIQHNRLDATILDVWEHEPDPDPILIDAVTLGTPHIAGHSYDDKVRGTIMLYDAVTAYFGRPPRWNPESVLAPAPEDHLTLTPPAASLDETAFLAALAQQAYPIADDDRRMRHLLTLPPADRPAAFIEFRRTYPRRRTFSRFTLPASGLSPLLQTAVTQGLTMNLTD